MMCRTTLLVVTIVPALPLVAQGQDTLISDRSVRINPIALIDPFGPSSVQLGLDQELSPRISIALEGGYFFQYLTGLSDAPASSFNGYNVRAQLTRWSKKPCCGEKKGIAIDVMYKFTEGTCRDSIKPDSLPSYSKDYHLTREVFSIRVFGVNRYQWNKRIYGEFRYGLGIRFKNGTATGITAVELDEIDNRDENGDSSDIPEAQHSVGAYWVLDFALGLRVGYYLR